jgi:hypothetical protein
MNISNRDWIKLSAYLDGELNPREQNNMKERIKNNPDLQRALDEIRLVKTTLHSTPRIKVPRDFSLNPEQVPVKPRPQPQYKSYRLAAVVMSFLFIGVLILDFGSIFLGGAMAPAYESSYEEVMLDAAEQAPVEELESAPLPAVEEAAEQDLATGGLEEQDQEIQEEAAAPEVELEGESEAFALAEKEPQATSSPPSDRTLNLSEVGEDKAVESEELPVTESDQADDEVVSDLEVHEIVPEELERQFRLPWLRILEIILAIGVLGFGTAAWIIRRRSK